MGPGLNCGRRAGTGKLQPVPGASRPRSEDSASCGSVRRTAVVELGSDGVTGSVAVAAGPVSF